MKKLTFRELTIKSSLFPKVTSTKNISPCETFIGRENAFKAMEFGLSMNKDGYNIFVVGPSGTGRKSFAISLAKRFSKLKKKYYDLIYTIDLDEPYSAKAILLPPGEGKKLKEKLENVSEDIFKNIQQTFESEEYEEKKKELENEYEQKKEEILQELSKKAIRLGFIVKLTPTGIVYAPQLDGKPLTQEQFEKLPEEIKQTYEENVKKLEHLISGAIYQLRKIDSIYREKFNDLDRYATLFSIESSFEELKSQFRYSEKLIDYFEKLKDHIVKQSVKIKNFEEWKNYIKHILTINLLVDNSNRKSAPVIFENNPTYPNLFGKVEYISKSGVLYTDFSMIRSGSIHKANGGYLILNAEDLLKFPYVWDKLKKTLISKKLTIENIDIAYGLNPTITLKPEPVELDLKVIIFGTPNLYYLLYEYDEDFKKLFKVKVEFDWEMDTTKENIKQYYSFISSVVENNRLNPLDSKALRRVIWYSMRLSENREKLSMKMGEIASLIIEADYHSKLRNSNMITDKDILDAIKERENRVRLLMDKYDESLKKYEIMIETHGKVVGQINGLTVSHFGDFSFGMPVKITAKTYVGNSGIIDIQRESDLSGNIHSKAVLTLMGYLGSKYATEFPLSIGVSISFEQVYGMVEGDSASLAETVAIISAISNIPVKQSIAVTGSINQHGIVQPIGGAIEKIEGFYRLCKHRGLDGSHGVIIPEANVKNLVLKDEILNDIKNGLFNIWTVKTVDEAIELLMDKKAGKLNTKGKYPKGTVNYMVVERLKKIHEYIDGKKGRR
ncbi:ATP-dependent protease [Thermosipho melanesiensis]|uniref:endopeptidase La n=2 Tax=Thermosipho melanesiensis TaxID=46541 RepID=A6LJU0_THEM4|nr:ATP-binding protein [Thermosipho melanesiensis]ABR30191.1 peptidase S16, lon domain protein [Thermosipho melanesiensis BI429]APT73390.1 ATP-dependent protease [Thermosipho melanesiensis]OOC38203.1 ATP-dependent protease [Thermosipho melanesiensis]OOC40124.1 ATP-dependent protease [Thermosipho melanesiensis]OOC40176.1 ATP-dependent protease [Thermosipho melanesiensis]